jgi:hypothetical protein
MVPGELFRKDRWTCLILGIKKEAPTPEGAGADSLAVNNYFFGVAYPNTPESTAQRTAR